MARILHLRHLAAAASQPQIPMCRFVCSRGYAAPASVPAATVSGAAQPLLQPPPEGDDSNALLLSRESGLDFEAEAVPTISVIGPSRRGKSVLAGLLAGGNPGLFPQSHSSFQAMTSGTHICEVQGADHGVGRLRIIDTEGLSHVGRSRGKREALVRQFLVSTYLTSSWVVWLDSEVLSTSFFTMMWLVHDYVVDILKVRNAAGDRLPRLMYIRTQETEVQQLEYRDSFGDFGTFFDRALAEHEDAEILTQMFAPGGLHGHTLPTWMVEDLESYSSGNFWGAEHASPFKSAVGSLRDILISPKLETAAQEVSGPPLLALAALEQHLPRIAKLEAFDPRDHEDAKIFRLRGHFRASYGHVVSGGVSGSGGASAAFGTLGGGATRIATRVDLMNCFDTEDRDVRRLDRRIDRVVQARLEAQCQKMRLDVAVAEADPEVAEVMQRFQTVAPFFEIAAECFAAETGPLTEREILLSATDSWGLDAKPAADALASMLAEAERRFLEATGFTAEEMRKLTLHERLRWRIGDCVMRLRGKVAAEMLLLEEASGAPAVEGASITEGSQQWVWRLGEWRWAPPPRDGKTVRPKKPSEYAVWTDGVSWALYEERRQKGVGAGGAKWAGTLRDRGTFSEGARAPLPGP